MRTQLPETQAARRGHAFYPQNLTPGLYDTEDTALAEKIITEHYFTSAGDWWICEYDPDSGRAFGYARLAAMPDCAEWGYIHLPELEEITTHNGLVIIERDCHWEPTRFAHVYEIAGVGEEV